jgi:hypothetical protein
VNVIASGYGKKNGVADPTLWLPPTHLHTQIGKNTDLINKRTPKFYVASFDR